jgi:hypothetical protein
MALAHAADETIRADAWKAQRVAEISIEPAQGEALCLRTRCCWATV